MGLFLPSNKCESHNELESDALVQSGDCILTWGHKDHVSDMMKGEVDAPPRENQADSTP